MLLKSYKSLRSHNNKIMFSIPLIVSSVFENKFIKFIFISNLA